MFTPPLTRLAVLIGSSCATGTYLAGVDADIHRMEQHLLSDFGGAWHQHEIRRLPEPAIADLTRLHVELTAAPPDYLLMFFAGHGLEGHNGKGPCWVLNRRDQRVAVADQFIPRIDRQIIISDACRVHAAGRLVEEVTEGPGIGSVPSASNRGACRRAFDRHLSNVSYGQVALLSCSDRQTSIGYEDGGLFTHTLVAPIAARAASDSEWGPTNKWWPLEKAFAVAKTRTMKANRSQVPTCFPDENAYEPGFKLPFAVAVT